MSEVKVSLPDIDHMFALIRTIHDLSLERAMLDVKIKDREAFVVNEVTSNPVYFIAGKTPSQEYIKNTFLHRGLEGELIPDRNRLAELTVEIEAAKLELGLLRDVIEIWRTQSANERNTY